MVISKTTAKTFLFDMDGTLIDSTPAVEAVWTIFAKEHNLDLEEVLRMSHGVRTVDSLKKWCGYTDPEQLKTEAFRFESMITKIAKERVARGETGLIVLPGVRNMLDKIEHQAHHNKWAIATSATNAYAGEALPTTNIAFPPVFITAEQVPKGKPNPDPYLIAAEKCGVPIEDCIVFEDAPSGILAGLSSGAQTIAVCTSHTREQVMKYKPTYCVTDLTKVSIEWNDDKREWELEIDESP